MFILHRCKSSDYHLYCMPFWKQSHSLELWSCSSRKKRLLIFLSAIFTDESCLFSDPVFRFLLFTPQINMRLRIPLVLLASKCLLHLVVMILAAIVLFIYLVYQFASLMNNGWRCLLSRWHVKLVVVVRFLAKTESAVLPLLPPPMPPPSPSLDDGWVETQRHAACAII